MGTDILIAVLIAIPLAFILAIGVTPIFELVRMIWYVPFIQKKLVANAVERGNVVKGKLIFQQQLDREGPRGTRIASQKVFAIYQYEWQGKTYKFRGTTYNRVPDTIKLYFLKNPRKAVPADGVGFKEHNWLRHYFGVGVVLTVILAVVMFFVVNGTISFSPDMITEFINNGF